MRYLTAFLMFILFLLGGIVFTALVYFGLWAVLIYACGMFGISDTISQLPLWITVLCFVIAFIQAIRRSLPKLEGLDWDAGTAEPAPSRVSVSGKGGRYWNVNPLGPKSMRSIVAVIAAIFLAGPCFLISAFASFVEILRERKT